MSMTKAISSGKEHRGEPRRYGADSSRRFERHSYVRAAKAADEAIEAFVAPEAPLRTAAEEYEDLLLDIECRASYEAEFWAEVDEVRVMNAYWDEVLLFERPEWDVDAARV